MSVQIVNPVVIQGPAYIGTGGVIMYVETDIQVEEIVESWTPKTTVADAGQRHKSRIFKLSYMPVGMLTSALLNYFYEAHLAPQTYVGRSIFPVSNQAVTIYSVAENMTYGYVRGGIGKPPDLFCGPGKTLFGAMELHCIGATGVSPTNANFIKQTSGGLGAPDTSFDVTKIKTDIYTGAIGNQGAPFNALGSMDGFQFKFGYKTKSIPAGDVGIADIILDSEGFDLSTQFAPSNLTEANLDSLIGYQGAAAVLPGQAYGASAAAGNLVLTGVVYGWAFTAAMMGSRSVKRIYQIGEHRFPKGALEMVNQLANTNGVPNPLFSFTAGT